MKRWPPHARAKVHEEEILWDSRNDHPAEEGVESKKLPLIDDEGSHDPYINHGSANDSPAPGTVRRSVFFQGGDDADSRLDIVTPTLAEIYFKQGQLQHALTIYKRLLEKDPGNDYLKQCIATVNAAIASGGEGIPTVEQERGKARRKIIEIADQVSLELPNPALQNQIMKYGRMKKGEKGRMGSIKESFVLNERIKGAAAFLKNTAATGCLSPMSWM